MITSRDDLEHLGLEELAALARELRIPGAAELGRADLIEAIARKRERQSQTAVPAPAVPPASAPAGTDVATVTVARLYLQQGKPGRAQEILRTVLEREPSNQEAARLLAEMAGIAPFSSTTMPPAPAPAAPASPASSYALEWKEPIGMLDLEEPPDHYGVDEVVVMPRDPWAVFVWYEITDDGKAAARGALAESDGAEVALTLRLVFTSVDAEGRVITDTRDAPVDWNHGRRYVDVPRPGAHVQAAVGMLGRRSGRFVPIVHSPRALVPRATPAPPGPVEWMEVLPDGSRGARHGRPEIVARTGPSLRAPFVRVPGEDQLIPGRDDVPTSGARPRSGSGGPGGPSGVRPTSPWRWRNGG